jgi:ABC-type nickel/cobalt efflux system permease component RcnA
MMAQRSSRPGARRRLIVIFTVLVLALCLPSVAWAHPLGNFTINQYAGLQVSRAGITIEYIMDMAEIPAFQEMTSFDLNVNGHPDLARASVYSSDKCASLEPDLKLGLDGRIADLKMKSSAVEFPPGAGGLATLRLTCTFQAESTSVQDDVHVTFTNNAYSERLGWNEIVVQADGISLRGDFATTSLSDHLTNYPQDLLSSPLDQRQITFDITAVGAPAEALLSATNRNVPVPGTVREDAFTRLIQLEELTLSTVLIALLISFIWGAMHAMTPGHGKTIVGAYLVGSRGTPKHALYLGLTTTVTHTLGVFTLGLVTLFAAQFIVPEILYPWMSFLSGLLVIGIGANLFVSRYRSSGMSKFTRPSPVTLSHQPVAEHVPANGQLHRHNYVLHASHSHPHPHPHDHPHSDDHHHHHDHDHGGHSHLPPGADGAPVTWRSLLLLGISGGIIPCPSALVVMLGAIALNRIGFGLILVLAFSFGLAGALTAVGLAFIYAGRLFERVPAKGRIVRILPVLSAFFITLIGLAITLRALQEAGVLRLGLV